MFCKSKKINLPFLPKCAAVAQFAEATVAGYAQCGAAVAVLPAVWQVVFADKRVWQGEVGDTFVGHQPLHFGRSAMFADENDWDVEALTIISWSWRSSDSYQWIRGCPVLGVDR